MKNIRWTYIMAAYLALLSFGLLDNIRGPFFPDLISDLSLRDDQASWFFAIASVVAFFGSYLAPRIQQTIGAIQGLRVGLLLISAGFYLMTLAESLFQLLLACAVFGMGMGVLQVFEHICIQEGSPPQLRRRLFNGLHSFYAAAAILAPLSATWIFDYGKSWRWGFKIVALVPLVTLVYALFVKKIDEKLEKPNIVKAKGQELKHMLYLSVALSLYVTAELSMSTRLVLYIQRTLGLESADSTMYLTGFFACLLLGRLLITFFDFARFSSRQVIVASLIASTTTYFLGLKLNPWLLSVSGFFMAPMFGMSMDYIAHTFHEKSSQAISLSFTVGSVLIVSMHYMVGLFTQWYGIENALYLGPVFLALGLFLFILEPRIFREKFEQLTDH